MNTQNNEKQPALSEEEIQLIVHHWIRILNIKLGWIHEFDKYVVNYVMFVLFLFHLLIVKHLFVANTFFILDAFLSSSKLCNTFIGHTGGVYDIDISTRDNSQLICSVSSDKTVRVWDINSNKQIQSNGHSAFAHGTKFSSYYYHNHRQNVICFSLYDKTIRFWDFENNKQLQIFNGHTNGVCGIEFSSFSSGRYLCSGSYDKT
ncbi:WD-40 repeat-containing protein, partial [Reticulomyxa filosa]